MTTEDRLTKLKAELASAKRRNRWTLAAAFVLVGPITAGNVRPPVDEVRPRRFIVVDAQANPRAELAVTAGRPRLIMRDEQGKVRARTG